MEIEDLAKEFGGSVTLKVQESKKTHDESLREKGLAKAKQVKIRKLLGSNLAGIESAQALIAEMSFELESAIEQGVDGSGVSDSETTAYLAKLVGECEKANRALGALESALSSK